MNTFGQIPNIPGIPGQEPEGFDDDPDGLMSPVIPQKIDYKAKDLELYNNWAASKSKKDMSILVNHLNPLIYKEVSRATGTLPVSALNAEGKIWAINAVKTYDPSKGFALSTHVSNYLQRVRRMNAKYQHVARLPENMKWDYHMYNNATSQLQDELNRDPTEQEVADRLGWSKGVVVKFRQRIFSDHIESANENPTEVLQYDDNNLLMKELMSHLTPDEKIILNYKGKITATELAAKLGVNNNRLNYLQNKLVNKITNLKHELRM